MKKITILLITLFGSYFVIQGQTISDLQQINSKSKTIYIKPEALDNLVLSLRPFEIMHGRGIDSLMLDTYKNISKGYADNNHFKQGYEIYDRYINYKIEMLNQQKLSTISAAAQSINNRKKKDDAAQIVQQNNILELQNNIDDLSSNIISFKKIFTIVIIALALFIAGLLVSTNVKLNNLKKQIQNNKNQIKINHRLSTLGKFAKGFLKSNHEKIIEVENSILDIKSAIKNSSSSHSKEADNLASSILKCTSELKA